MSHLKIGQALEKKKLKEIKRSLLMIQNTRYLFSRLNLISQIQIKMSIENLEMKLMTMPLNLKMLTKIFMR